MAENGGTPVLNNDCVRRVVVQELVQGDKDLGAIPETTPPSVPSVTLAVAATISVFIATPTATTFVASHVSTSAALEAARWTDCLVRRL